jgi:two-component system, chemotaxis family, protein-glutamate methylesterase/glutaminase
MRFRSGPIRLLVVEDSPTIRDFLLNLFHNSGDIQVVGTAADGEEAVQQAGRLRPDVITMDIHMPRMDGLEATRRIMQTTPTPIVMVTAGLNRSETDLTFEAIRAGALTVVKKPGLADTETCERIVQTVRLMADVPVVTRFSRTTTATTSSAPTAAPRPVAEIPPLSETTYTYSPPPAGPIRPTNGGTVRMHDMQGRMIIGIASSTGGPNALLNTLKPLPANYPLPILVVQHITKGFASSLTDWLNGQLQLEVRLAEQGDLLRPGTVLIAPDERHMQVSDRGSILLHTSPPYKGLRPSANYLFYSLARVYGKLCVGIILTGMGDDGVDGLAQMHQLGGLTVAQDEASCVVYGMPREAVLRKAVDFVLPLDQIGTALMQLPV